MKIIAVLSAATIRSLKPRLFDGVSYHLLAEAISQRYQFRAAPSPEQLSQPTLSVTFVHGVFNHANRTIVIDQLSITNLLNRVTSIGASSKTSTDFVDSFLEDLLTWIATEHRLDTSNLLPVSYQTQLDVEVEKPISEKFRALGALGIAITNLLKSHRLELATGYELAGFSMQVDQTKVRDIPFPTAFLIERRVGVPYQENRYFSQAPLKTKDHEAVLGQLEQILSA